MITVRITGGLGNQMFQYAIARRLALKHKTGIRFDLDLFKESRAYIHRFELDQLNIAQYTTPGPAGAFYLTLLRAAASRLCRFGMSIPNVYWEREVKPDFDPNVLALPNPTFLNGYFQSERYFLDIADTIRKEFMPSDPNIIKRVEAALMAIRRPGRCLVSVHVRRSNYLSVRPDGSLLVPLKKIQMTLARFENADFLVFSDDLAWCRQNIHGDDVHYSPFKTGLEDLTAMTCCDHHIIANSTFSWWGAWLNPSPAKVVIAPANWGEPGSDRDGGLHDLYPPSWIKI